MYWLTSGPVSRTARRVGLVGAVCAAATTLAVAGPAHAEPASNVNSQGVETLSYTHPDRLIQSTGNLYWTADQTGYEVTAGHVQSFDHAYIYRASKDNTPGQEVQLYQETQAAPSSGLSVDFEAITYANVDGNWYGYFVANYPSQNESQIKRVPLAGGPAVVLATSPAVIGNRDLVTDGSFLYWGDSEGIRKMPIGGGAVQTLVSGTTFAHLGLDGSTLYYASGNEIMYVPTSGGTPITVAQAQSTITALYPPTATNPRVYWGEVNGSVSFFPGNYGLPQYAQTPQGATTITSVFAGADDVLWGEDVANGGYEVAGWVTARSFPVAFSAAGPVVDLQGDSNAYYWGDSYLEKRLND